MESMKHVLDNTHLTISPDSKVIIMGIINDKKEWVLGSLQDRTAEFLMVLFKYAGVGKPVFLESDDKTYSILIRDVTAVRKDLEKKKSMHRTKIIGINGKPLN